MSGPTDFHRKGLVQVVDSAQSSGDGAPAARAEERLESWKEIAAYFKRDVRTVQRWEQRGHLPVHRLTDNLGGVYAFRSELDAWRANSQQQLAERPPPAVETTVDSFAPSQTGRKRRILGFSALSGVALLVSVFLAIGAVRLRQNGVSHDRHLAASSPVKVRRTLAVFGFKNLSNHRDKAWLSTALAEMLTTELAAGETLRTLSGEDVARAKADLSLSNTDGYSRDTLLRLREDSGADLVATGSYMDLASRSGAQIRVDLRIQDARTGETIASVSEVGTESELFQLISHAGSDLRPKIGVGEVSAVDLASVRASYPSTPEAARVYAEGSEKLRLYDAIGAKALLEKAVAADPKYPLAHSALAMAWVALGYDAEAGESAKTAFELSGNLSREERLLVEGDYREVSKQWPLAIDIYRTLFSFFPDNLEFGIRLAAAQSSGGKPQDALNTLKSLRKLPPPLGEDPR